MSFDYRSGYWIMWGLWLLTLITLILVMWEYVPDPFQNNAIHGKDYDNTICSLGSLIVPCSEKLIQNNDCEASSNHIYCKEVRGK